VGDSGAKNFIAAPKDVFVRRYNRDLSLISDSMSMNWYEVITGRCRLYVDIDNSTVDDLFSALSWLNAEFPTDAWKIFHRDARSFHIIGTSVFESPMLLGDELHGRNAPRSFDMSIYTKNRCWKLPFSRKFGKGSMMVPFDVETSSRRQITEDDLVVLAPACEAAPQALTTRTRQTTRTRITTLPKRTVDIPRELSGVMRRMRRSYGEFYDITEIQRGVYRLSCRSRQCGIAKRKHRRNHIFIVVDMINNRYRQCCYNEHCKREKPTWIPL